MIPDGHADFLVALELLEGLRWIWMLRPGGRVIADDRRVPPSPVSTGSAEYPAQPEEPLAERGLVLPATQLAGQAGVPRAANVLVLGALSVHLDLPPEAWDEALAGVIKTRHLVTNRGLFRAGRDLALERLNRATDG
jgi:indolepyruvate ferredoxin oxidoreductase beta subunit